MDYTFDWTLAFEQAKQNNRKLLDEHIEKAYYERLLPAIKMKTNFEDEAHNICTLVLKKFWERFYIREEKIPTNVNGYLFMMANNAIIDQNKMKSKKRNLISNQDINDVTHKFQQHILEQAAADTKVEIEEKEKMFDALDFAFTKLDEKCRNLLKLNILEKNRIKAIYQRLGFTSQNAATKKKTSCIKRLKKLVYLEIHQQNIKTHG